MVLGTKFVAFSTRHRGYFRRVFLRYRHVPRDHPGGEAAIALETACAILAAADGCIGVLKQATATRNKASTAPNTSSRSPTPPAATRTSTAVARTANPASHNSAVPSGTAA
ncbi:hypothetical protein ACIQVO_27725 [Streptomyces sp. NPDC101062]|uniref:hypothetical protein n=1 Tax=unclassified Streptomyces TaxID=2593676 RepID=UPI0038051ACD